MNRDKAQLYTRYLPIDTYWWNYMSNKDFLKASRGAHAPPCTRTRARPPLTRMLDTATQ